MDRSCAVCGLELPPHTSPGRPATVCAPPAACRKVLGWVTRLERHARLHPNEAPHLRWRLLSGPGPLFAAGVDLVDQPGDLFQYECRIPHPRSAEGE